MFGRDALFMLGFALQIALAALVTPITSRLLDAHGFGLVAAASAVMQVLMVILSLGMSIGVQRARTRPGGERVAKEVLGFGTLFAAVLTAALWFSAPHWASLLAFAAAVGVLRLGIVWAGLMAVSAIQMGLLRAESRLAPFLVASLLQTVGAQVLGASLLAALGGGPSTYLYGMVVGQAAGVLAAFVAVPPSFSLVAGRRRISGTVLFSLPLIMQGLATYVYTASDRLVIGDELGSSAVGRYQIAYNIAGAGIILISVITQVWLARVLRARSDAVRALVASMRSSLLYVAGVVTLGLCVGGPALVVVWAPPSYRPGALTTVIVLVSLSGLAYAFYSVPYQALTAAGRTGVTALASTAAAVLNLGLNIPLVHLLGIDGSAATTLGAYLLLAAWTTVAARRVAAVPGIRPVQLGFAAAVAAVGVASTALPTSGVADVARWVIAVACAVWLVVELRSLMRRGRPIATMPGTRLAGAHFGGSR